MYKRQHLKDAPYVASLHQCTPEILQQLNHETLRALLNQCPHTKTHLAHLVDNIDPALWEPLLQTKSTGDIPRHHQKFLTHMVRSQDFATYKATLDPRGNAQLHSTSGTGAGAWLRAPTRDTPILTNQQLHVATRLRLNKKSKTTRQPAPKPPTPGDAPHP